MLVVADSPVGQSLYVAAAGGGARAMGIKAGAIAEGCSADLVVLDAADPALAEQNIDAVLDAAIFGPCRKPVSDVMVAGRWVVRGGHHAREDAVLDRYRKTLADLWR